MLVLLTTSNFPDIMLPAYEKNKFTGLFFISYLIIGLFFLMNLLLCIFYSNFKSRFEQKISKKENRRSEYLYKEFEKIGGGKKTLNKF
jgi:hypothetical protein